jgi:hypothetical protein
MVHFTLPQPSLPLVERMGETAAHHWPVALTVAFWGICRRSWYGLPAHPPSMRFSALSSVLRCMGCVPHRIPLGRAPAACGWAPGRTNPNFSHCALQVMWEGCCIGLPPKQHNPTHCALQVVWEGCWSGLPPKQHRWGSLAALKAGRGAHRTRHLQNTPRLSGPALYKAPAASGKQAALAAAQERT